MAKESMPSTSTVEIEEESIDTTNKRFSKEDVIALISLILLIVIVSCISIFATPTEKPMKCNDPHIYREMIPKGYFNWDTFILVLGSLLVLATILWVEISFKPKNYYDSPIKLIDRLIGLSRLALTVGNGIWLAILVALISNYSIGKLAPNFVKACQPLNLQKMCYLKASHIIYVTCTTPSSWWVPARSASVSDSAVIQSFLMIFIALYAHYRINTPAKTRYLKYIVQTVAVIFIWSTGFAVVKRNEATWIAVMNGYLIGSLAGLTTVLLLRNWLNWPTEEEMELPYYWNETDVTIHQEVPMPIDYVPLPEKTSAKIAVEKLKQPITPEIDHPPPIPLRQITPKDPPDNFQLIPL